MGEGGVGTHHVEGSGAPVLCLPATDTDPDSYFSYRTLAIFGERLKCMLDAAITIIVDVYAFMQFGRATIASSPTIDGRSKTKQTLSNQTQPVKGPPSCPFADGHSLCNRNPRVECRLRALLRRCKQHQILELYCILCVCMNE